MFFIFYMLKKIRAGRQDFFKLFLSLFFSIQRAYGTFKGYLRDKTIISQNVPSEVQVIFFLFRKRVMVRFQDIHVFSFLTIPWFTKSVTSWWVIVHETGCIYEYKFWTTTHYVTKLSQLIHINKGINFQESLEQLGWLGLNSSSFSIQHPAPITQ